MSFCHNVIYPRCPPGTPIPCKLRPVYAQDSSDRLAAGEANPKWDPTLLILKPEYKQERIEQ